MLMPKGFGSIFHERNKRQFMDSAQNYRTGTNASQCSISTFPDLTSSQYVIEAYQPPNTKNEIWAIPSDRSDETLYFSNPFSPAVCDGALNSSSFFQEDGTIFTYSAVKEKSSIEQNYPEIGENITINDLYAWLRQTSMNTSREESTDDTKKLSRLFSRRLSTMQETEAVKPSSESPPHISGIPFSDRTLTGYAANKERERKRMNLLREETRAGHSISKRIQSAAARALEDSYSTKKCYEKHTSTDRTTQNRQKSKRYYERRKAQSQAIAAIYKAIQVRTQHQTIPAANTLIETHIAEFTESDVSEISIDLLNQDRPSNQIKQRTAKVLRNIIEINQIEEIQKFTEKVIKSIEQLSNPEELLKLLLLHIQEPELTREPQADRICKGIDVEKIGLDIWLDHSEYWNDLILAERRLSNSSKHRPILRIISLLAQAN